MKLRVLILLFCVSILIGGISFSLKSNYPTESIEEAKEADELCQLLCEAFEKEGFNVYTITRSTTPKNLTIFCFLEKNIYPKDSNHEKFMRFWFSLECLVKKNTLFDAIALVQQYEYNNSSITFWLKTPKKNNGKR